MGSSKKVTIGYRYYLGIHMGLGRGPVNELVEIEVGGKKAWQGSVTGNTSVNIDKPNLFGGDKKEGGIRGTLQVLMPWRYWASASVYQISVSTASSWQK